MRTQDWSAQLPVWNFDGTSATAQLQPAWQWTDDWLSIVQEPIFNAPRLTLVRDQPTSDAEEMLRTLVAEANALPRDWVPDSQHDVERRSDTTLALMELQGQVFLAEDSD